METSIFCVPSRGIALLLPGIPSPARSQREISWRISWISLYLVEWLFSSLATKTHQNPWQILGQIVDALTLS